MNRLAPDSKLGHNATVHDLEARHAPTVRIAPPDRVEAATDAQRESAMSLWVAADGVRALAWCLDHADPEQRRQRLAGLLPELHDAYAEYVAAERTNIEDASRMKR